MNSAPVLRVARPTDQLERIARMYVDALRFEILGRFVDHQGYDGIILGHPDSQYHLEFTTNRQAAANVASSDEHLLVFYFPDRGEWARACLRMARAGFLNARSANPYWDSSGNTFVDADGARVVLQNACWPD